ncbi:hypothetical protein AB205_0105380 [Aquarana catesbeiana]|uniref:Uncharacterized protein n=1 Tax=Aquarana catesbeiana TaxID=8400 RepID=A0A2G9R5J2_AQUCT|nr:hypothetical protein AB205_0105380 [Aquarana catesbeiana]
MPCVIPRVFRSGCDEEEGISSMVDGTDIITPLSTGYNTRSNSMEQISTPAGEEEVSPGKYTLEVLPTKRSRTASELLTCRPLTFLELSESSHFFRSQSRPLRLLFALYHLVAAHSELVCYFIIILNNMVSASLISLFLPILVFLWAMLSIHRPSKKFWMTAIVFTEIMVVIKYLCQFGFFPWNNAEKEKPRDPEKRKKRKPAAVRMKMIGLKVETVFIRMAKGVYKPVKSFFHDILHTPYRAATDVYALMFLADVVDFVIIVFGFWAFGKHSAAADITSSLSDDQVPEAFLVMLLIQFSTMVIDRALYLRKTVLGKLIFQVILVIGIHVWMFFILPAVTERRFSQNTVAQLWYFVKCIYFALSAYQIRCGYPTRILGNFLTKKYNHVNLFLFQGFCLVPFLVELRAVMDWVWTDTTLSLSN